MSYRKRAHSLFPVLLTLCTLCMAVWTFAACSSHAADGDDPSDGEDAFAKNGVYFELRVSSQNSSNSTRGPQGGETGDATEWGFERERKVENATLLLYSDANGVNGDDNTVIAHALYAPQLNAVTDGSNTFYRTELLHADQNIARGLYHILVVCNMGDCTRFQGKTLGDVRNEIETTLYTLTSATDPATASHFVMAQATDATVDLNSATGGISNPISLNVTVERLAARIDFSPGTALKNTAGDAYDLSSNTITLDDGSSVTATGYTYNVRSVTDNAENGDKFILTSVTSFNLLQSGTRLLKCVSADYDGSSPLSFMGKETKDAATGMATNYVLDPWTTQKQSAAVTGLSYSNTYDEAQSGTLAEDAVRPVDTSISYDGNNYYILAYAHENTVTPQSRKTLFATGIMLSGYYGKKNADGSLTYTPKTYYYYIRHADPNNSGSDNIPMKYGIVRNNIYRLHINRVTSMGIILIEVSDWTPIIVPDIEM